MTATAPKNIQNDQLGIIDPLKAWQEPVQCKKCKDIIWSSYRGEFVWCKCKAIAVDQTPHYSRYIGEREDFLFPEKDNFIFKDQD